MAKGANRRKAEGKARRRPLAAARAARVLPRTLDEAVADLLALLGDAERAYFRREPRWDAHDEAVYRTWVSFVVARHELVHNAALRAGCGGEGLWIEDAAHRVLQALVAALGAEAGGTAR